jgi:dihydroorotase
MSAGTVLIKGGTVVNADGSAGKADVLVRDGMISELGTGGSGDTVIDATGLLVAPGVVDMHVHLREPGQEGKETIASGTRAAALGGVTTVVCMPNTTPALDTSAIISYLMGRVERDAVVRVHPMGTLSVGRAGEVIAEYGGLKDAGAVAFTDDGNCIMNALLARRAMTNLAALGMPYVEHSEDASLVEAGSMNEGYMSVRLGLRGRPALAEEVIIARDLLLAEDTGAHLHVAHLSCARSVEMIRQAKKRGARVTCEVTAHHLALTEAAVEGYDTNARVDPPLRSEADRTALISGVLDGTIDAVVSDHAPHGPLEKDIEFAQASPGMIGLQTILPLANEVLALGARMKPGALFGPLSANPARILKLKGGKVEKGAPADLVLWDEKAKWTLTREAIASRSYNTPFLGRKMTGKVVHTLVGGRVIVRDGELSGGK